MDDQSTEIDRRRPAAAEPDPADPRYPEAGRHPDGARRAAPQAEFHPPSHHPHEGDSPLLLPAPPERLALPPPRARTRRPWGKWLLWIAIVALAVGALVWLLPRGGGQPARTGRFAQGGTMPVGAAVVAKGDMPVTLNALGTVTPLASVTVRTQISGLLMQVGFQEGQLVKQGDFLAEIDPRPYQLTLAQAQGQLAKDQALLRNAEIDLQRYRTLVSQDSAPRQQRDTQESLVRQYQGAIQVDQAQVDAAKLNLIYCHIVAPISGRVGLRQVDPGNYVQTGDTNGIVVITQLEPISTIFTLPEDTLPAVAKRVKSGARLTVAASDRSNSTILARGRLSTIDNQIDTTTGTIKLRAIFDNDDGVLFPNQFVNIKLLVDTLHDLPILPASAIQRGAPGTFVYIVKPDETVAVQKVTLGPSDGEKVAVTEGVKAGDTIVIDGADRLRDGAKVTLPKTGDSPSAPAAGQTRTRGNRRNGGNGAASTPEGAGDAPAGSAGATAPSPTSPSETKPGGDPAAAQPAPGTPTAAGAADASGHATDGEHQRGSRRRQRDAQ